MKRFLLQIILLSGLIVPSIPCTTIADGEGVRPSGNSESYTYEAFSRLNGYGKQRESIQMKIITNDYGSLLIVRTNRKDNLEILKISTDQKGRFSSGTREIFLPHAVETRKDQLWHDGRTVSIARRVGNGRKIRKLKIPENIPLAVDASLLYLLRSFPFDTEAQWRIFMVDFSGHSVRITARHTRTEMVIVPAGDFDCYRIEVTVNLPIFQPKILIWLIKSEPHFLVKHSGKRGPFTPTYETTLKTIE